jgi:Mn2+/Fe2+ NRAMP family transporter
MADAAEMLTHLSSRIWAVVFAIAISVATIRLRYYQIANALKWLALVLFAYVATPLVIHVDWSGAIRDTFIPTIPRTKEAWETLVALLGTTISPYLFFWQTSQEIEEQKAAGRNTIAKRRGASETEIRNRRLDVAAGSFFSQMVMYFIILTTAFTLHSHGYTNIETSKDAAMALQPLAGPLAATLYAVGIIGVGFLAIPTLTGSAAYAFADVFGWNQGLDKHLQHARAFYLMILISTAAAVVMDFLNFSPVKALYWSAVINGVLAPFLLVGILIVASDGKSMAGQPSSGLARTVVAITTLLMFVAAVAMVVL